MNTDGTDKRESFTEALSTGSIRKLATWAVGDSGDLQTQMIQGTGGTFLLRITSAGLGFITSLVLARVLGAGSFGSYAYALSWVSILVIPAMMGGPQLLTREISRYKSKENWEALRGILRRSDQVVLAVSLGISLVGVVLTEFLGEGLDAETQTALWAAALLLPPFAFVRIRQSSLRGLGHVIKAQVPLKLILPVLFLSLIGLGYWVGSLSAPVAVGMRALAAGVALLVVSILLRKYLSDRTSGNSYEYHSPEWLQSALPMLLIAGANVVNQRVSVIMLGSMVGAEAAGIFDVARRGVGLVAFALAAVNMPLAPTIAQLYSEGELERMQQVVTKSARVALLGSLPIGVGLIFLREPFLLLYGEEFTKGKTVLTILCVGQLANGGLGSVVQIMNMTGYEGHVALVLIISAVVNLVLNYTLIPVWGLEGAAVATSGSMILWNLCLTKVIRNIHGVNSTAFK